MSLACNICFIPSMLALASAVMTFFDRARIDPERRTSAMVQASLGLFMATVWPLAIAGGMAFGVMSMTDQQRADVVAGYMRAFSGYMPEREGKPAEAVQVLQVPAEHDPATPLPTAIFLHGYGSTPDLVRDAYFERLANGYGMAIIGVSAPLEWASEEENESPGYQWLEFPVTDAMRVTAALDALEGQVVPESGRSVLFGFSQGAAVAAELAAREPERYAGAILISPGAFTKLALASLAKSARLDQRYVITVGAGEDADTLTAARAYERALREHGAEVQLREVAGQTEHDLPDDFYAQFGPWLEYVLAPRGGLARVTSERSLVEARFRELAAQTIAEGYTAPEDLGQWLLDDLGATSLETPGELADAIVNELLQARRAEEAGWPAETDCDRLDRAFGDLIESGILARQHYEDCGTCAMAAIGGELDAAKTADKPLRGYTFFHMQDTEGAARGEGLYLSYGAAGDFGDDEAAKAAYREAALAIGHEVVEKLRAAGLQTTWSGELDERIAITPLDWKRRLFQPQ